LEIHIASEEKKFQPWLKIIFTIVRESFNHG